MADRPEHHAFHDAEFGAIPDTDELVREKVLLACFQRRTPLADVLDRRPEIWEALCGCDMARIAALDDAALDAIAARGGLFADRARLAWVRDVARACAATAKQYKELREYFLAVRWLPAVEQIDELCARFPGFAREDAVNLMTLLGTGEGEAHDRECWRRDPRV